MICDALALRARRVRALFIAGLQEGAFPAPAREEPFLSAGERAELARRSGLVLGAPVDALGGRALPVLRALLAPDAHGCG